MENREGILDEIEELVSDFEKAERGHNISVDDFVKEYMNHSNTAGTGTGIGDFYSPTYQEQQFREGVFLEQLTQRQIFRQEYPDKDFNRIIPYHCRCGENFTIFIWEQLRRNIDYQQELIINNNWGEKNFFCMKCGERVYMSMETDFNIVAIKHDLNFII